ncbi:aldehyde dehydrogenase family protein [Rhodobacter sp. TJ_12]|uniref:aldehyde dehydrogenase family protein n=1 Tax=Rhodobacter sp. TJ_12 TaxID=2029399 RepID=UPI001CBFA574|nr:aldehyde dehydrogenase family protein [Rhodobacter sp. TJ_12]
MDHSCFYIGGAWVAPLTPHPFGVENPATEKIVTEISLGTAADVDLAVAAAKSAFPAWAATPVAERRALMARFLALYQARYEEMVQAISTEMGAPVTMAREQQADTGIGHTQGFLDALDHLVWEWQLDNGDTLMREPIGVVGLITPWNWPVNQIALKVVPALLTGCTCVLKPSEIAPLSAMLFTELLDQAGFPAGVFNLVNGDGPTVGAALSRHRDIAMMSFTGSTRAGAAVSCDAAQTVKRVTLELGGKSPNLVFADCDLETQVAASVAECMNNTGQSCDAPTRLIVERAVYDKVVDLARAAALATEVGDPAVEGPHIGPLVSAQQWARVQALIEAGLEDGARLVAGGPGMPEGMECGHYAKPTIFADVTPEMRLWKEEVFGPVLVITPFEDEAEAIALANDSPYGLAAYVQTGDPVRARRVAKALRAGMVHLNGAPHSYGSPFGGYGQSGNGREGGLLGLEDFTEVKAVHGL